MKVYNFGMISVVVMRSWVMMVVIGSEVMLDLLGEELSKPVVEELMMNDEVVGRMYTEEHGW